MKQYVYRHAALAGAVDIPQAIALNQLGAAVAITVPAGCTKIESIGVDVSESVVAPAGDEGGTLELVLSGNGMVSETHLPAGTITNDTTTVAGTTVYMPKLVKVDIPVVGTGAIDLNGFIHGVTPGTVELGVCLCFT